jgi:hypothetical protein
MTSAPNKKLIASIPLILPSKDAKIKIGKINDPIDSEKCIITKDPNTKTYKLIEKKGKSEIRYSGSLLAEQSSKYFIFKYNEDTKKIEAYPGDDWFTFKKEINYNTMSLEEAEERLKGKTGFTEYIRSKGNVTKGGKKEKAFKEEEIHTATKATASKFNDEDEDVLDEVKQFAFNKDEKSEEDREEDLDPELKDIPSDIEEVYLTKSKDKENVLQADAFDDFEDEAESESVDSFFGKDADNEDVDDEEGLSSEIENEDDLSENNNKKNNISGSTTKDHEYLGNKRKGDDNKINNSSDRGKKQRTATQLEETLDILIAKNKRMTYEKIVKELQKLDYKNEEISSYLPIILSRSYGKYPQGGENYYFKKSDK